MAEVIVIGAGICGLGTSLLLARDGHHVTVLERDDTALPDTPQQAWEDWGRRGIAQFRQPHNFMPGLREVLEAELPDVQGSLVNAGATKFDLLNPHPFPADAAQPIDDRLWTYTARRPVGEWVFADIAGDEPNVTIHRGVRVAELVSGPSVRKGTPHVTGVRLTGGDCLQADLVVDVTGRGSRAAKWLAALGARPLIEEESDSGFTYYTRYFEGAMPERVGPVIWSYGTFSVLTLPGDNDTWSVSIFTSSGDTALKSLGDADRWTKVVGACPTQAHWLDGKPITDVMRMAGVVDRYRRFVVDGQPVATGFVCVADAWACTNPSAGRGLTVGFKHAQHLRDSLRDGLEDLYDLALRFDLVTEREVTPWYTAQRVADRYRFAEIEALRGGLERPPVTDELFHSIAQLFMSMFADPDLYRATLEYIGTLAPVQTILERPEIAEKIAAVKAAGVKLPPTPGPDRARLLELVA